MFSRTAKPDSSTVVRTKRRRLPAPLGLVGIHPTQEAGHGFQRAAVVAVTYEEGAAADEVDGVLFVAVTQVAGLLESQPGGKTGCRVTGSWGIASRCSQQCPQVFELDPQLSGRFLIALVRPRRSGGLVGRYDGEVLRQLAGRQLEFEAGFEVVGAHESLEASPVAKHMSIGAAADVVNDAVGDGYFAFRCGEVEKGGHFVEQGNCGFAAFDQIEGCGPSAGGV